MTTSSPPPPPRLSYRLMHAVMWPLLTPLRMSCRHFAQLCSERLDRPLTPYERLCLRMHRLVCGVCRPLPKQFEKLHHLVRCCGDHSEPEDSGTELSSEARAAIREALQNETHKPDGS